MRVEDTIYINYLGIKKSKIELEDSLLGFFGGPKELEYQEGILE